MFGEKLQALLDDNDISQSKLASELGVTSQAVNRWCSNTTQPDYDTLVTIAEKLDVSIDYLLGNDLKDIKVEEKNKQLVQSLVDGLTNPLNKALYSKASELKNDRDKEAVLKIFEVYHKKNHTNYIKKTRLLT